MSRLIFFLWMLLINNKIIIDLNYIYNWYFFIVVNIYICLVIKFLKTNLILKFYYKFNKMCDKSKYLFYIQMLYFFL